MKRLRREIQGTGLNLPATLIHDIENQNQRKERLTKICNWLAAPDPSINYQKALDQRQDDTGLWLLESDWYAKWKTEAASYLWLRGIPGCGKTILSSIILENLLSDCDNSPDKVVAYFYFDFNDMQKQNPELMMRSLICQLLQQGIGISATLDAIFSSCGTEQRPPSLHALLESIQQMTQGFPCIYIILDALDECIERAKLTHIMETIAAWRLPNLHILVTSRLERDIKSSLETFIPAENVIGLQSDIVDVDIHQYIKQRMSNDKRLRKWRKDINLIQEIETALMNGSHGMYAYRSCKPLSYRANDQPRFRWAVCQLDMLGECRSKASLRRSLATLPPTLDKTYDRILSSISEVDSQYAIPILQWLAFSARPLSIH